MGCVLCSAASPQAPGSGPKKGRASSQPAHSTGSLAAGGDGDGSPGKVWRLPLRRKPGPRDGCVPSPAVAELLAAGWPRWLVAGAAEAIHGLKPRCVDTYEKLDKIGTGTYSHVYRARDSDSGRIVALKKVRLDHTNVDSVKFMAREILFLRKLDHPNVIKLEGVVTSRLSFGLYLVFEYMEHDLTGLAASPYVKFTLPQIKCYMQQLLLGLEHCHENNVLHRDIKGSNLLLDNDGVLKIGDFGLAISFDPSHKRPMTNRVVTLWYRAPELLMGATDYGVGVDLWSAGCILAELLCGRPILPGRTEVEQLHKIFKLCGSPSEEYWKKVKLPRGTQFKPQPPYKGCFREAFKDFPPCALQLLERLLSIDPSERQTATAALQSEFFASEPYACDSSSLPTYPPSKEIDVKRRDEKAKRSRAAENTQGEVARRTRTRDRSHRAGPVPDANAELQENLDRRRMFIHANGKSKSEKFPPPHQDGAVGNPLASHQVAPFSTVVPVQKGTSQTWSGPLFDPAALGQSKRKKQTAVDAKAVVYSTQQLQKENGVIRAR